VRADRKLFVAIAKHDHRLAAPVAIDTRDGAAELTIVPRWICQ
jgi:hypothetical protein